MAKTQTGFGIIGLGTIGENLALQALEKGVRVVAYDLNSLSPELREAGVTSVAQRAALRAIGVMRHGFGAHPFGPDEGVARHRRGSRVGPLSRPEDWL